MTEDTSAKDKHVDNMIAVGTFTTLYPTPYIAVNRVGRVVGTYTVPAGSEAPAEAARHHFAAELAAGATLYVQVGEP